MERLRGREAIGHISAVSLLNFSDEVRADMELPKRAILADMTIREGRQLEGVVLTVDQCLRIARELDELGVPSMQMIYNASFPEELELMTRLSKLGLKAQVEVLEGGHQIPPSYSRQSQAEVIDRILDYGFTPYLCVALSNTILRAFAEFRGQKDKTLDYLKEDELQAGVQAVQRVKRQKGRIGANVQDPMRCDLDYLDRVCRELANAGIDYMSFDDIACPGTPAVYKYILRRARKAAPNTAFGVYPHDDFGFGLGAALASFEGGAEVIHCTINGYGKRGGMVDLAQLAVVLEFMYGYDTGIHLEKLTDVSRLIADIYRQPLPTVRAVTGANAYAHGASWHVQFGSNPDYPNPDYPWVVESVAPEVVGQKRRVALYSISGDIAVRARAAQLGISLSVEQGVRVWAEAREDMKWRSRPLTDDEFIKIVRRALPELKILQPVLPAVPPQRK